MLINTQKQERDPDISYLMKSLNEPSSTEFNVSNCKYFLDHDGIVYKERSGNEREDYSHLSLCASIFCIAFTRHLSLVIKVEAAPTV